MATRTTRPNNRPGACPANWRLWPRPLLGLFRKRIQKGCPAQFELAAQTSAGPRCLRRCEKQFLCIQLLLADPELRKCLPNAALPRSANVGCVEDGAPAALLEVKAPSRGLDRMPLAIGQAMSGRKPSDGRFDVDESYCQRPVAKLGRGIKTATSASADLSPDLYCSKIVPTPSIPKGWHSAARSAPRLAAPSTRTPAARANRISLCQTDGEDSRKTPSIKADRLRAVAHRLQDVAAAPGARRSPKAVSHPFPDRRCWGRQRSRSCRHASPGHDCIQRAGTEAHHPVAGG